MSHVYGLILLVVFLSIAVAYRWRSSKRGASATADMPVCNGGDAAIVGEHVFAAVLYGWTGLLCGRFVGMQGFGLGPTAALMLAAVTGLGSGLWALYKLHRRKPSERDLQEVWCSDSSAEG